MAAGIVYKTLKDGTGSSFSGAFYDDGSGNLYPIHITTNATGQINDTTHPIYVSKSQQTIVDCVIPSGSNISDSFVDLGAGRLVGLATPSTFEPTTLSFVVSHDGTTSTALRDSTGLEVTVTNVTINSRFVLSPTNFLGVRYLKLQAGTTASPGSVVGSNRTVKLIVEY